MIMTDVPPIYILVNINSVKCACRNAWGPVSLPKSELQASYHSVMGVFGPQPLWRSLAKFEIWIRSDRWNHRFRYGLHLPKFRLSDYLCMFNIHSSCLHLYWPPDWLSFAELHVNYRCLAWGTEFPWWRKPRSNPREVEGCMWSRGKFHCSRLQQVSSSDPLIDKAWFSL